MSDPWSPSPLLDLATGAGLLVVLIFVALFEWSGAAVFSELADALTLPLIALLTLPAPWSRRAFVVVAGGLILAAMATRPDWLEIIDHALRSASFIAAFFAALAILRTAAAGSAAITRCGRFLAQQPPGRRYLALTLGGQLFGILLNYGALALLGGLAEASARREPDEEIRRHRIRRMLLAIQRGFVSTLPWSPIAFAVAISTSVIPGASWADAVLPCLGSGLLLAGTGWAMDTIFKPKLSGPRPPRRTPEGGWASLWPLALLLGLLVIGVIGLQMLGGVRTVAAVMVLAPTLALVWIAIQSGRADAPSLGERVYLYAARELPGYRGEILLLVMAGFIGGLGGRLLAPLLAEAGIDLSALPAWTLLLALVWLIPLTGQLGMNPILTVSLLGPLLPEASTIGLEPVDLMVAATAGWALSGASSPYTATTLLIGALGGVSAHHVGLRWNGAYTLVCGTLLSGWVLLVAAI